MQIIINRLDITAFKGIKSLSLFFDGKDAEIMGRNGSGKTSVYDAFLWLLFGKDSNGAAKFDVRPLNEDGAFKTGVDTEVECELMVDGKRTILKRVLHEKYKTLPNTYSPIYTGTETLCWIDDVPVKLEKEFQPYVASIVGDEETFKLLAIHGYFLRLPWEQRRKYLVNAAGGNAEDEILRKPEFASVPEILQGKSVEEARKRLKDQKKRLSEENDSIPNRIDELHRALPDVTAAQAEAAKAAIELLDVEISQINGQISGGMEVFEKARALMDAERRVTARMEARLIELRKPAKDAQRECEEALENARSRYASQQREYERMSADAASIKTSIAHLQESRESKLAAWHATNDEEYTPPAVTTVCAYCGQPLPEHKIQEMLDNAHSEWERKKTSRLDEISAEGRTTANRIEHLQAELKGIQESLDRKYTFLEESRQRVSELESRQIELGKQPVDIEPTDDAEYMACMNDLKEIRRQMKATGDGSMRAELEKQRKEKQEQQAEHRSILAKYETGLTMLNRITALLDQKKKIGADMARVEGELEMLSQFNTACCFAMEDSINKMFGLIRWKLFDYLKDGTVKDCCTATVYGIPFDTGLNHAAQINAGIETIRVLSRSLGVSVPCFVDNAEAVNTMEYTGGQMIKLIVSKDEQIVMIKEG